MPLKSWGGQKFNHLRIFREIRTRATMQNVQCRIVFRRGSATFSKLRGELKAFASFGLARRGKTAKKMESVS